MKEEEYQVYLLGRRLGWAKNMDELDQAMKKAVKKGVQPDDWAKKLYAEKKTQYSAGQTK